MTQLQEESAPSNEHLGAGSWRPALQSTWLTEPFWEAARQGRLIVQRCTKCGSYIFRPQFACTNCLSTSLEWTQSSGRGVINSYSIVRRPAYPDLPAIYAVVAVEMNEGWYMMSNLIDCEIADVRIGLKVMVRFMEVSGRTLPFVVPDSPPLKR